MTILKQRKQTLLKDHELWKFSLKFFEDEVNRNALIYLQDHYQLNINIMLALIWHAASGRGECTVSQVKNLNEIISPWQTQLTEELRVIRKKTSKKNQQVYQLALTTEVYSERVQQNIIYDFFATAFKRINHPEKQARQGATNLQRYFSICNTSLSEEAYQYTRNLLSNAFISFNDYAFPQLSLEL